MQNSNLTGPFAWASLVARFEPEATTITTQLGDATASVIEEPTLEIITHDLEASRWDDVREYLELAIDDMLAKAKVAFEAKRYEQALAELTAINAEFAEEPAKAPEAKAKSRCPEHGVWARESDGRCKRCDTPDVLATVRETLRQANNGTPLTQDAGQMLTAVLVEALKAKAKAPVKVTQESRPDAPAKLGVRANGMLARRSAHELAPFVKATQRELAQMTADEARSLVLAAGLEVDWVPAKDL